MALATALEKLDAAPAATRSIARGAAHMCIVDPAERRIASGEGFLSRFASHPPITARVTRLKGMAFQQSKA